jgi:C4-dicarboxylate-specific signal transduction histidine kinase
VLGLYAAPTGAGPAARRAAADALPPIRATPPQLRQVIHNLVQNALDAVAERPDGRCR